VSASLRAGAHFAGFRLDELLGTGGNAVVWRAQREDLGEVALKILKTKKVESEPYARFRREVSALKRIGDRPSVLPLLDAQVPQPNGRKETAWLAMPLAQPIAAALEDASTRGVVEAAATLAATLASLQAELQLFHRDLKPNNLYWHRGGPALGDFGLVALPDAEQLTGNDKPLGPANFVPYEMLCEPADADPAPADVYSFAKTVWVLLSGQRWPPAGEQHADNEAYSLRQYRAHARLREIDELLARCTRLTPSDRPSMQQVANDLAAWLAMEDVPNGLPDLSAYGKQLREAAAPEISERERRDRLEERCGELADDLARRLKPIQQALRDEYPLVETDVWDQLVENLLGHHEYCGSASLVSQEARATRVLAGDEMTIDLALIIGWCVSVTGDGLAHVKGLLELGPRRTSGTLGHKLLDMGTAPADSLEAQQLVVRLVADIASQFPDWFARFTEAVVRHNTRT
jgi:hypothetical protein